MRKFLPVPLKEDELRTILRAALMAPSSKGSHCWQFVVVKDSDTLQRLSRCKQMGAEFLAAAPCAVVVLADGEAANWLQDGSLVIGNLMTAAASIGVGSCWINRAKEYFDMPAGKEVLKKWGLDEKYRGVGICVLGYADGPVPAAKPRKADYIRRV